MQVLATGFVALSMMMQIPRIVSEFLLALSKSVFFPTPTRFPLLVSAEVMGLKIKKSMKKTQEVLINQAKDKIKISIVGTYKNKDRVIEKLKDAIEEVKKA